MGVIFNNIHLILHTCRSIPQTCYCLEFQLSLNWSKDKKKVCPQKNLSLHTEDFQSIFWPLKQRHDIAESLRNFLIWDRIHMDHFWVRNWKILSKIEILLKITTISGGELDRYAQLMQYLQYIVLHETAFYASFDG